ALKSGPLGNAFQNRFRAPSIAWFNSSTLLLKSRPASRAFPCWSAIVGQGGNSDGRNGCELHCPKQAAALPRSSTNGGGGVVMSGPSFIFQALYGEEGPR